LYRYTNDEVTRGWLRIFTSAICAKLVGKCGIRCLFLLKVILNRRLQERHVLLLRCRYHQKVSTEVFLTNSHRYSPPTLNDDRYNGLCIVLDRPWSESRIQRNIVVTIKYSLHKFSEIILHCKRLERWLVFWHF